MKTAFSLHADTQCPGVLNATNRTSSDLNVTMYQSHQSRLIHKLSAEATYSANSENLMLQMLTYKQLRKFIKGDSTSLNFQVKYTIPIFS